MSQVRSEPVVVSCKHCQDIGTYKDKLFLCRPCCLMLCRECAEQHEHETIPPVEKQ